MTRIKTRTEYAIYHNIDLRAAWCLQALTKT